jgi:hypothetical protein
MHAPHRRLPALCAVALFASAACTENPPPPRDAAPVQCFTTEPSGENVAWFALTGIGIDNSTSWNSPHTGFNLDGLFSTALDLDGCTHDDDYSAIDLDQNCADADAGMCATGGAPCNRYDVRCAPGVDNQLPTSANVLEQLALPTGHVDLRRASAAEISAGRFVTLVEVVGLDDCREDASVRVRLFRGFAARNTPCSGPALDGVYQIDRISLRPGGTTPDDALVEIPGVLTNRRVRALRSDDAIVFPFHLPAHVAPPQLWLNAPAHHPMIAFDLAADGTSATNGNFGAWIGAADLIAALGPLQADPKFEQNVVAGLLDIAVDGHCAEWQPPLSRGGMSIGFGFSAQRVRLDPAHPVVDAPDTGSCGGDVLRDE